jgi:hypothetical protein
MNSRTYRHPSSVRWLGGTAAVAALLSLAACADQQITGPGSEPEALFSHGTPAVVPGELMVCKHVAAGNGVDFDFTASTDADPDELLMSSFTLQDGECEVVWTRPAGVLGDPANVTITELVPAGWQIDRIVVHADILGDPFEVSATNEVTVPVNPFHGATVVFHNSQMTVGTEGCTPGYWRNTRLEWPIAPTTLFSDAFGVGPETPLSETVEARGGARTRCCGTRLRRS